MKNQASILPCGRVGVNPKGVPLRHPFLAVFRGILANVGTENGRGLRLPNSIGDECLNSITRGCSLCTKTRPEIEHT
jgi:hypothetical protein